MEATGIVIESAEIPDGSFAYTLTYTVTDSTAYNADGELIAGELSQHIFGGDKLVRAGQKIKLLYKRDEPTEFQLLEKIQYR